MTRMRNALVAVIACCTLSACVSQTVSSTRVPALNSPSEAVPEELLIDLGVVTFDAGLDDYDEDSDLPLYPEVRRAEALFMPQQLAEALRDSGAWGAVRVLPTEDQSTDLLVTGKILHSDGESLKLHINATDSLNTVWLDKTYIGKVSRYAYKTTARAELDPFQAVFNTVANDLLAALEAQPEKARRHVRLATELHFARRFSEEAFSGYLVENSSGNYEIQRLPAQDDPMLRRIQKIRERDHIFVDTLQEYYAEFDETMATPYHEWRRLSYEEVIAIREIKAESRRQTITGVIAVLGGLAAGIEGDSATTRAAGQLAVIGGAYLLKSGLLKRDETQMHIEALEELGTSLEAEIAPRVIELEDRSITLSGTVEEQYAQWRELLAEIYRAELGFPDSGDTTPDNPATI